MAFLKTPTQNLPKAANTNASQMFYVLVACLALIGPAHGCEFEPKRNGFFGKMLFPEITRFTLLSDPTQNPDVQLTRGRKPNSVHMPTTKQLKRMRVVRGEKVRVEDSRSRSGKTFGYYFKEDKDAFAGSLRLSEHSEHYASGWSFKISSLNGKTAWATLNYDTPRRISEALDDAICTYQSLPQLVAQAD
jgi:hypothetical protein